MKVLGTYTSVGMSRGFSEDSCVWCSGYRLGSVVGLFFTKHHPPR